MKVINGGRNKLERDLVCEIFRPGDNRETVAELIYQLAPRGELSLQPVLVCYTAVPPEGAEMTIEQPLAFSMNIMGRELKYVVFADDGVCVARCLDVEVTSDGDTKDDAIANLREALELYFEGLSRDYKEIQVGYHHTPS